MKLLTNKQKQNLSATGYMDKWVAMMGVGFALSAISSIVSLIINAVNTSKSVDSTYKYSYSNINSSMIRMSAFPSRSSVNFWI